MAQYGLENIRNLALLAHNGAGKTSLAEAILFNTKIINRLGKVSEGSTTSDYDPAEQKRGMSISLSMLPYIWQGNKINLMDTPGYPDFPCNDSYSASHPFLAFPRHPVAGSK